MGAGGLVRRVGLASAIVTLAAVGARAEPLTSAPYSVRDTAAARLTLDEAREAFAAGEPRRGAAAIQRLLGDLRDDLVRRPGDGGTEPEVSDVQVRYVSAPEAAVRLLESLTPEQRAAYEEAVLPTATAMLEIAEAKRDPKGLAEVLARFPGTRPATTAARRLAEHAAETGRPIEAAAWAARGLRGAPLDEGLTARRIDALLDAGEAETLAALRLPEPLANRPFPAGEPTLAARLEAARRALPIAAGASLGGLWGGSAARDRLSPHDHVMRPLRWTGGRVPVDRRLDAPADAMGRRFRFGDGGSYNAGQLERRKARATPYVPVVAGRTLYHADGFGVEALDLLSGRRLWRFPDPGRPVRGLTLVRPGAGELDGRTNLDVVHTAVVHDGLVYAAVEVEDRGYAPRTLFGVDITTYQPRRVLVALDAATGALRWRMGAELDDARALDDTSVAGGPVVAQGLVVVPAVRFVKRWEVRLVALDARTGRVAWQRKLVTSQQELNLFGEPVKELWAGTPAVAHDTVYAPTGVGVMAAADLRTGEIRWVSSYDTLPIQRVDLWYETPIRLTRWGPSPTVVSGDTVLAAPAESPYLLAFSRHDGLLRWRWAAETDGDPLVDHFLGVVPGGTEGLAVVTGHAIHALDLATGNPVWRNRFSSRATVRGRGALSTTRVYVPSDEGLDLFSIPAEGRLLAPSPMGWPVGSEPGNVVLTPQVLVVATGRRTALVDPAADGPVQAFFAPDDIERELATRRVASPLDPGPMLETGDLWRLVGQETKARSAYDDARRLALAAGDALAVERAREGLLLLERDRGDAALGSRRLADARRAYEAALSLATSAAERVDLRLRLDRVFSATEVENDRLRNLEALVTEAGDESAVFEPREGPLPVRPAARFRLADLHRAAGRVVDAVDVLQDVLREDGDAVLRNERAGVRAERVIAAILAQAGPGAYRRHEAEAARRLAAAAGGDDPAPFASILREFPNARAVPTALLGLALRERMAGRNGAAAETLGRFLSTYPDHPDAASALAALVRALAATGSAGRARAALARLEHRYPGATVSVDGAETPVEAFVEATRRGLGSPAPRPARPPLARTPDERISETVDGQGLGARCVPIVGRKGAETDLPALVHAEDALVALDPVTDAVRWRLTLQGTAFAAVAGDTLVVAAADLALGLDPATGRERWRRDLAGNVLDIGVALGQAVVLVQALAVAQRTRLVAIDPVSGAVAWREEMPGEPAGVLHCSDEAVVVLRNRGGGLPANTATVYAPLTGARRHELPRGFDALTDHAPAIVDGRVLVGVVRDGDASWFEGVDLLTGAVRFSTPLPRPGGRRSDFVQRQLFLDGATALLVEATGAVRRFRLDDGALVHETMVTGGLPWHGSRALVRVGDRLVAVVRDGHPTRVALTAFDLRTGKAVWRSREVYPNVQQCLLLADGGSVVAVLTPMPSRIAGTGDYRIVVADPADGQAVHISAAGLGSWTPSAELVDGALVVAGLRRFALFR